MTSTDEHLPKGLQQFVHLSYGDTDGPDRWKLDEGIPLVVYDVREPLETMMFAVDPSFRGEPEGHGQQPKGAEASQDQDKDCCDAPLG
jgi:hypothetical protein